VIFIIIEQVLLTLPLIIGAYIAISLMKVPHLSIESAYLFGAAITAVAAPFLHPIALFALAIVGGIMVGLVTSILNQVYRIPYLLAAILTNGFFHGVTLFCLGTSVVTFTNSDNPLLYSETTEFITLAIVAGCLCTGMYFLFRTKLGYSFAIYGNNPNFFQHHGTSTRFVVIVGILIADGCGGLSGYIFAQSSGFVDLMMGYGIFLTTITALILGKILINSHRPTLLVPLCGSIAYYIIQQGIISLGFDLKYFNTFQAIIVFVSIVLLSKRLFKENSLAVDQLGV